jgi:hypothetical protein
MKTKKAAFNIWAKFQVAFIVLSGIYFAYGKYCHFYQLKENALFSKFYNSYFLNTTFNYYGKLTGAGAGYGFFAPNVRTSGLILGECGGKKIFPKFKSFESDLRFSALSAKITNNLLEGTDTIANKTLKDRYINLIFKSIAVKIYNQNNCTQDTALISYNLMAFPTIPEYAAGHHDYYLIKVKEVRLTK